MKIGDAHFFKNNLLFYQPLPFYGKDLNPFKYINVGIQLDYKQ